MDPMCILGTDSSSYHHMLLVDFSSLVPRITELSRVKLPEAI
jgi:hypothetical protein